MRNQSWRLSANCASVDQNFSLGLEPVTNKEIGIVCGNCEVSASCLQDALDANDVAFGVRGGLRPRARQRLIDAHE